MPNLKKLRTQLEGNVLQAALSLLGRDLVRGSLRARLVEVEAYRGHGDPGCHTFRGMTPRTRIMFGKAGLAYAYFTYGNHWMLNVVAGPEGEGSAVLLRAARPLSGLEAMRERRPKAARDRDLLSGPGKLAASFGVTQGDYGLDLFDPHSDLHIELGEPPARVLVGPRIGLTAGQGDEFPWRFIDAGALEWVSRPLKKARPLPELSELER